MARFRRAIGLVGLLSSLMANVVAQGPLSFPTEQHYAVGNDPRSVAHGDLNGDGALDLVSANSGSDNISVLLGTGTGSYGAKMDLGAGNGPLSVAIGDLNGDGSLDLVTANYNSHDASVLLGTGTGSFGAQATFGVGAHPTSIAVGDLNGDGHSDLVVANSDVYPNPGSVSVLLGTGTGVFGPHVDYGVGMTPWSVALGDLDGDAATDVVTANTNSNTVSVLLGTGTGSLSAQAVFSTGNYSATVYPIFVAIGDLNGDGSLDLVTANIGSGNVSILLGVGTGGFSTPSLWGGVYGVGAAPICVAIGDLSGDGTPDLVTAGSPASPKSILLGTGTGSFGALTNIGAGGCSVAICDLNGDGAPDLATAGGSSVSVLLGAGPGSLLAQKTLATGSEPHSVGAGDLNGDGRPDVVTANFKSDNVSVLLAAGAGSFGAATHFGVGAYPLFVAIGDLSGDGAPDVVTSNHAENDVSVLLGSGTGSLGVQTKFRVGTKPLSLAIGDLNGDGASDLVTSNSGGYPGAGDVSVLLGAGTGSFGMQTTFGVGIEPSSVGIGDLNIDGMPDLAIANSYSNSISVLLGMGAGGFASQVSYGVGIYPSSVAIDDFNGDSLPDLVAANYISHSVSVLLGTGAGSFGAPTTFVVAAYPACLAVVDLNGDGARDIVTAGASAFSVLLGTGIGTFVAMAKIHIDGFLYSIACADMDGEGLPDVIVANGSSDSASIVFQPSSPPSIPGMLAYGTGTWGCAGKLGLTANSPPTIGKSTFAIVGSNAPHNAAGLLVGTDVPDLSGSDPFHVNMLVHVGLAGATEVLALNVVSGPSGEQFAPVPIPNSPILVGKTYYLQSFWVEPPDQRCTPALAGFVSSRGLAVTVQP